MEDEKKKKKRFPLEALALVFVFFAFLFFRGSVNFAVGSVSDNIRGYAWSSNYGWISFNCMNNNSCGSSDYGVGIYDFTTPGKVFNFEGHAWSPDAGWISFNEPGAPDYSFNARCESVCDSASSPPCTACFNPDNGKVYGWAKVLSLGNDGWLKLSSTTQSTGVSIDLGSASGTFSGWAWNGNTEKYKGLGWVSFSCANTGTCATANYSVYLASSHLPQPKSLSAPNWSFADACPAPGAAGGVALNSLLKWDFYDQDCVGNCQTAFQVIVNTVNSTTTPPPLINTGKRLLSATQYNASNTHGLLSYDQPYYWWVRIWDNFGFVSKWAQFNTAVSGHSLTDNNFRNGQIGSALTYSTYRHEFPEAKFHRAPLEPLAYYPVTSTLAGFYYNSGAPSTRVACDETHCSTTWTGVNNLSNSATTSSSTVMTFKYGAGAQINLKLEDIGQTADDNYSCVSSSPSFFVDLLPIWYEKKAQ